MSALTLTIVRLGFLALLWLFVLSAFSVVRADLFGTRSARAESARSARAGAVRAGSSGHGGVVAAGRRGRRRDQGAGLPQAVRVVAGPDTGMSVPLDGPEVGIGRGSENALALSDDYASTAHARFVRREDDWFVEDLGSTNGTYLDGERLRTASRVEVGMPVRIGKTTVELTGSPW